MATPQHKIRTEFEMPDIFHAAETDDVDELRMALANGQRLDMRNPRLLNMTPIHLACIRSSNSFLEAAIGNNTCDPWLRDDNLRVAFDHAAARNNRPAMEITLRAMYREPL